MRGSDDLPTVRPGVRVGVGAAVVVVLLALGVTVVIGMVRSGGSTEVMDAAASTSPSAAPFGQVYVHVAGAVATPGMYRLESGARLADAIAAAGGFTADADRAAVNLARTVSDGEQLVVPVVGTSPQGGTAPAAGDGLVNLNTADAAALDTLPGVGPATAARILAWREEHGRFGSVDDLLSVSGIGEKTLDELRDKVTV